MVPTPNLLAFLVTIFIMTLSRAPPSPLITKSGVSKGVPYKQQEKLLLRRSGGSEGFCARAEVKERWISY
jgi:hypothetical protein